ncbi:MULTISPECIES: Flp pilus assembly protein CpaB [unclassified Ruegeria]|jgi:pilus assembly protein CpaB|uniref:Flp pilus assembly protein CpaB n=1 Tax=unclassified Ruegeria TaxID=2625375 RepID=UPI001ADA57F6|nr:MULTISPECIES: Flp pilus assembly protein CpaB [unclassified Ruegeria]MBO9411413.1 Flp pilus assembly protein CpaB [Ruegeria sp. R8_1]MBO9416025.1 Flp pilus assembly protein CpaB [Ruegeria sp. R8_2]
MRVKSFLMTFLGVGLAGGAVLIAQDQIQRNQEAAADASIVRVVAVAEDIPFGTPIERYKLTTIEWPAESVPAGVFTNFDDVLPETGADPRRAKRALAQGEILLASKVSDFGEKVTIVQTIGENNRAVAISVDAQTGVGGFVTPGDFVDIVLTRGSNDELRAITILQNIRIIGVDQTADEELDQPGIARTVTVEVTPQQGQRLALAQKAGQLSLSLRSLNTEDDEPLEAVRLSDILLEKSPAEDGEPQPIVKVRRGISEVEEFRVENPTAASAEQDVPVTDTSGTVN